jgi:predicted ATPase
VWIETFALSNFKSFDATPIISLDKHINILVGQNHSGKTTLLNALTLKLVPIPHNSSKYRVGEPRVPASRLDLTFVMSGQELRDYLAGFDSQMRFPISESWAHEANGDSQKVLLRVFDLKEIRFTIRRQATPNGTGWQMPPDYPSNNLKISPRHFIHFARNANSTDFHVVQMTRGDTDDAAIIAANRLPSSIYYFDAQRTPSDTFDYGNSATLNPNAQNLPEVLSLLQARRTEYFEFVMAVRRVLPAIKWVSVEASKQNGRQAQIRIWNLEESEGRHDLTLPLSEGGTGVGQVLAILYVVLRSSGNIIVIDEPNSFLHPRAAKELISILREDRNNQYILSTHYPEIVVAADPERYFVLRFRNEKTELETAARSDLLKARQTLEELGSQLSDIFGADSVVWVEGPTEVQCFPLLLASSKKKAAPNIAIAALRNTGDLEGKQASAIADIYRNLTSSHAIIPTSAALCLDGDKANIANLNSLKDAFGSVHFLARRCYENYLINVNALSDTLNGLEYFKSTPTSVDAVNAWILQNGSDPKYGAKDHAPFTTKWIETVDAPRLLDNLFQQLSDATETFRKPLHSVQLTKWLLQNDRDALQELVNFVVSAVPSADF